VKRGEARLPGPSHTVNRIPGNSVARCRVHGILMAEQYNLKLLCINNVKMRLVICFARVLLFQ